MEGVILSMMFNTFKKLKTCKPHKTFKPSKTCFQIRKQQTYPKKSNTGWWLGHPSEKYEFVNWDD